MLMNLQPPAPLEYFASLVQSDKGFPLIEAAASLAQDEYPQLDLQQVLDDVERLQARLNQRGIHYLTVAERLIRLNLFFYDELQFGPHHEPREHHANHDGGDEDPENHYLHHVLAQRQGSAVPLALLWLELAKDVYLNAHGVFFAGQLLIRVLPGQGQQIVIDPLNGRSLSPAHLAQRLHPGDARMAALVEQRMPGLLLQTATPREIIAHMLRNLQAIFEAQRDFARLLGVQNRLMTLLPTDWETLRERALTYRQLGLVERAIEDLQQYLAHVHQGPCAQEAAQALEQLRMQR